MDPQEVRITYKWPDGATLYVALPIISTYPDALDQARGTVLRMFEGALDIVTAERVEDDADDTEDRDVV